MKGYNILYICDYAAAYSGNFIASLSALAKRAKEQNNVFFLFPKAVEGIFWLDLLPVSPDCIFFCDFNVKSLFQTCRQLSKKFKSQPTLVHTHFVGDLFLLAIKCSFKNVICHFHMTSFETTTFLKKIKRIIRQIAYHNILIVGVSNAVTQDLKKFFPHNTCVCIPNAIDFQNLMSLNKGLPKDIIFDHQKFNILIHNKAYKTVTSNILLNAFISLML